MKKLTEIIADQKNPEWSKNIITWHRWRDSINGDLDKGHVEPQVKYTRVNKWAKSTNDNTSGYLLRFRYETLESYRERLLLSQDFGTSGYVVGKYVGHTLRAGTTLKLDGFSDEIKDIIENDIDMQGTTFKVYYQELLAENYGMGKCWQIVDITETGRPVVLIIPREQVLDWHYDDMGLQFVMYENEIDIVNESNMERITVPQRILITRDKKLTFAFVKDKWILANTINNELGYVPAFDAWMGKDGESIIDIISKLQVNLYNIDSEARKIIRDQALNILAVPKGTDLTTLSSDSVLFIKGGDYEPSWLTYPSSGLDAHFSYIKFLNDTIFTIGYEGRNSDEFIDILKNNNIKMLIDVRYSAKSERKPQFNKDILKKELERNEIGYIHYPELGIPYLIQSPYKEGKFSFDCLKQWYYWHIETEVEFEKIMKFLKEIGKPVIMCMEKYAKKMRDQKYACHRDILAEMILTFSGDDNMIKFEHRIDL